MVDDNGPKWRVATTFISFGIFIDVFYSFVGASTARNLSSPTLFRTYTPPCHASYSCKRSGQRAFLPQYQYRRCECKGNIHSWRLAIKRPGEGCLERSVVDLPWSMHTPVCFLSEAEDRELLVFHSAIHDTLHGVWNSTVMPRRQT